MAVVSLKERAIQIGYILGVSLVLAAIIYFFASNWLGLEKNFKVALSVGLMTLFYGVACFTAMFFKRRPFLSQLLLFSGVISFGVTIALLGQIYNSHADSYMLFLIWLIPVILFSFVIKSEPFYLLAFILFHLAVWFFLFPSFSFFMTDIWTMRIFLLAVGCVNLALLFLLEIKWRQIKALPWLAFIVFHLSFLVLSINEWSDRFSFAMSFVYLIVLIALFRYFLIKERGGYTILLGVVGALLVIARFIVFIFYIGVEYIFLLTILFPIFLIWLAVYLIRKFREHRLLQKKAVRRALLAFVVFSASAIAARSVLGIIYMIFGWATPNFIVLLVTIGVFFLPILLKENWDDLIRYSMLLTGIMLGSWVALFDSRWLTLLYLLALLLLFLRMHGIVVKYVLFALMYSVFTTLLFKFDLAMEMVFLLTTCMNMAIVFASRRVTDKLAIILYRNGYLYGLFSAFVLTFLNKDSMLFYFLINGLFFVFTTWLIFSALRKEKPFEFRLSILFWFSFIVYKYYDLLWALLHKSLTFFVVGAVILLVTRYSDRGVVQEFVPRRRKWVAISLIFVLQCAIIGGQIVKSEHVLANGELIKLQLQPVDPRSLLQGDYVILRYTISDLEQVEKFGVYEKVFIGLAKSEDGFYKFKEALTKEQFAVKDKEQADVWIAGKHLGGGMIAYGIENYFIEEGTGAQYERSVRVAYVKVATNGDAILVSIE